MGMVGIWLWPWSRVISLRSVDGLVLFFRLRIVLSHRNRLSNNRLRNRDGLGLSWSRLLVGSRLLLGSGLLVGSRLLSRWLYRSWLGGRLLGSRLGGSRFGCRWLERRGPVGVGRLGGRGLLRRWWLGVRLCRGRRRGSSAGLCGGSWWRSSARLGQRGCSR
jgi:hypothetical protein